jgi:uncharacterized protein (TIGR03577 family)/PRD domain protein (TIGR03582 family)
MYLIEDVLLEIPQKIKLTADESADIHDLLTTLKQYAGDIGLRIPHTKAVVIGIHLLVYIRRITNQEFLPKLEDNMFDELSAEFVSLSKRLLESYKISRVDGLDDAEIFYLAVHFEAVKFDDQEATVVENKVKIVIGDRLGKGQNVAKGVEAAGGIAIVIPGIGADMKLGDVMHQENADLGICFCGSGGAGAVTANTKYKYPMEFGLRSIDAGVTAVREGKKVIGFGFMDVEELGRRLTEAYIKRNRG